MNDDNKENQYKNSDAKRAANRKYLSSVESIRIRVPKSSEENNFKDKINEHAKRAGISANQYMIEAIQARMDQEDAASK